MPPRNLYAIIVVALVSVLCHEKAERFRNGSLIGDAIALIDRFYVDEVQERSLVEAAMQGLTGELDPYTQFIPPQAYDAFQDSIQQEFAGIGILIDQPQPEQPVRVVTPLVGSPALEAGFRPGDRIIAVAGQDTRGMKMDDVRKLLQGPIGSQVRVVVQRRAGGDPTLAERFSEPADESAETPPVSGDQAPVKATPPGNEPEVEGEPTAPATDTEPDSDPPAATRDNDVAVDDSASTDDLATDQFEEVRLEVRRANIMLESVMGDYRDEDNRWVFQLRDRPQIAYVRLSGFGEQTTRELGDVLQALPQDCEGLVLDLRGNSGGLLISAVEVCDMFLDAGRIVSTRGRGVLDPERQETAQITESAYDATPGTLVDPQLPLAVLIDGNSASASEIVAACLKDHGRATVVGSRTFGKGSVQNVFAMEGGRSALKMTTARYYRPNGDNIHRSPEATEEDAWGVRPSRGGRVVLDDEARLQLQRRWEMATYPSMALALPETDTLEIPLSEIDPALRRAVEILNESAEDSGHEPAAGLTGDEEAAAA